MFGSSKKSRIFASQFRKMVCPDGGIGRRAGLKHQWIHFHPGSTPGLGTGKRGTRVSLFFCFYVLINQGCTRHSVHCLNGSP